MLTLCCILLRRRQELYQYRAWVVVSFLYCTGVWRCLGVRDLSNSATLFLYIFDTMQRKFAIFVLSLEREVDIRIANERLKILFLSQEIANFNQ